MLLYCGFSLKSREIRHIFSLINIKMARPWIKMVREQAPAFLHILSAVKHIPIHPLKRLLDPGKRQIHPLKRLLDPGKRQSHPTAPGSSGLPADPGKWTDPYL